MRTCMAIGTTLLNELSYALDGNRVWRSLIPGLVPRGSRVFRDVHGFLGDLTVCNPVRTELGFLLIPGRYQDVIRLRLAGIRNVRARRIRLGGGVRVVDHHRFLVAIVHLAPHPELLERVEAVEGGGTFGVLHRDEPLRAVAADRAGDNAAGLVWVVLASVGDDLRPQVAGDRQHDR